MVLTIASICFVASPLRSASRCTSSATTLKPRPASPADAAWIAAFSARTFVCSVMSEISSTISPISSDDSPRRLIRFDVSWIWPRISFIPAIWFCTATAPFSAAFSDCCATRADCAADCDTSLIDCAICRTDADACWISFDCRCDASYSRFEISCVSRVAFVTCSVDELIPTTTLRNSSTVKLIESAIAPVTSSVTDALTVRSPSASVPISFRSRRIASWFRRFSCSLPYARCRASSRYTLARIARLAAPSNPKSTANTDAIVWPRRSLTYASDSTRVFSSSGSDSPLIVRAESLAAISFCMLARIAPTRCS